MKEKKIFRFCSLALIGVLAFAAGCSKPEPQEELPGTEVILDRNMQNGVDVLGTVSIESPISSVISTAFPPMPSAFGSSDSGVRNSALRTRAKNRRTETITY